MSARLGIFQFDLWNGPAPPAIKSTVELLFRPGQSTAAAKIQPAQSTVSGFQGIVFLPSVSSHVVADAYRGVIGTIQPLLYGGVNWGHVLVQDVTVEEIAQISHASGVHPDGTNYSYWPAGRVTSRWTIARLSS